MKLPKKISYLAENGQMLMPQSWLPLLISDNKQLKSIEKAFARKRFIGVVQTKTEEGTDIYGVGCLGKIINFSENEDSTIAVMLQGLSRFDIIAEDKSLLTVNYENYKDSDDKQSEPTGYNKDKFISILKEYSNIVNLEVNWVEINKYYDEYLINSLAMFCPFAPNEKQAILESKSLEERIHIMAAFMQMTNMSKLSGANLLQ